MHINAYQSVVHLLSFLLADKQVYLCSFSLALYRDHSRLPFTANHFLLFPVPVYHNFIARGY